MTTRWLEISIPVQLLLILTQAVTGYLAYTDRISDHAFITLHLPSGYLLVALVLVHVIINSDWLAKHYFRRGKAKDNADAEE